MRHRLISSMSIAVLTMASLNAQSTQTGSGMTNAEFRQVMVDLGTYLDAHRGTNLANQFSNMTEEQIGAVAPSVVNPAQLKAAVAALKQEDTADASGLPKRERPNVVSRGQSLVPLAVVGSCAPNSIIDNSPGASCTPSYPDPTNTAWQNLVNPLITFGAFSPTDYPSVSSQQCSLTVESNLVQTVSALNGTVTVASIGCSALQAIPIGGTIAAGVCDAAVAVVGVAGAVSQGLLADCSEQDGNVNAAEIDAAFHNTVTIYNALGGLQSQLTNVGNQIDTMLSTDNGVITNLINGVTSNLTTDSNLINTNLLNYTSGINTNIANDSAKITSEFTAAANQLTSVNNTITGEFSAVNTTLNNNNNQE